MCSPLCFEVKSETNISLLETSYGELFQLPSASVYIIL